MLAAVSPVNTPEFATLGDNCIDRFLPPLGECLVGGNAVNVAVQLAMLGCRVHYFGAVGGDEAGRRVSDALQDRNVLLDHLQVMRGQCTAYTDIEVSADGERTFVFEEFGACALYRPSEADLFALRRMRHIHIGWLSGVPRVRQALAGSGAVLSQDLTVNNRPEDLDPSGLDIAFCSASPEQGQDLAKALLARGAKLAVVTLGAAGSLLDDGSVQLRAEPPVLVPEDTTGAGDAFIAGFIAAHAACRSLGDCLAEGTRRSAQACLHRGGFPQIPLSGPECGNMITKL